MNMIINGVALLIAVSVFATFVAQVLAPLRRSALWAAPAHTPLTPDFASTLVSTSAEVIGLDGHRRPATSTVTESIAA